MSEPSAGSASARPTLGTVAAAAGVAPSTVSRALASPGRVNAVTRQRIETIARELGYTSPAMQRPRSARRIVAVFVADITNPFYFDLVRGAQQQLAAAGYLQLLIDTEESAELEEAALRRLSGAFDGAILASTRLSNRALSEIVDEVPLVVMNRAVKGVPGVVIDSAVGTAQAVQHLVSLGHRDIVYAAGPDRSWANQLRWRALAEAAQQAGVTARSLGPFAPTRAAGSAAADAVVTSGATACIAYNDLLAIGMLRRLQERGVRVPDDLSLVGCDDIFGADFCHPPLTTLTAPVDRAGRVAVSLLLGLLDADRPERRETVSLPSHLTVRESTGPAPARAAPSGP